MKFAGVLSVSQWTRGLLLAWCALALTQAAVAQTSGFPDKPIKLVVPAPAGGSVDALARLIGGKLSDALGQPVVVDNRAGGNTIIGTSYVAKSPADGYTLLVHINSVLLTHYVYTKLPYDFFNDLTPVSQLALSRNLLTVSSSFPSSSLADFVKAAKSNPSTNYGSYGSGTASNLYGELLNQQAGLKLVHVPYRGAGPLLNDMLGGQVTSAFIDVATVKAHLGSGKLKVLAVTGPSRLMDLPDVPTFLELGYKGFEPSGWFGVFAPAKTPTAVLARLSSEIEKALKMPDVKQRITELSLIPAGGERAEFERAIKADAQTWEKIIKESGIKVEP